MSFITPAPRHGNEIRAESQVIAGRAAGPGNNVHLPYVLRDARLRVVFRGLVGVVPVSLEKGGLYTLEILTPNGAYLTKVVQVKPFTRLHIFVGRQDPNNFQLWLPSIYTDRTISVPIQDVDSGELVWRQYMDQTNEEGRGSTPPGHDVDEREQMLNSAFDVEAASGCVVEWIGSNVIIMPIEDQPEQVFTATFRIGHQRSVMSLPLNPAGSWTGRRACIVSLVREHGRDRLRLSFPPPRDLCAVMDGLLRRDSAATAIEVFKRCGRELRIGPQDIQVSYDDPAGVYVSGASDVDPLAAALSCLTLHRFGRLDERRVVELLGEEFQWVPDGRIVYAALLMKETQESERIRGLRMLLSATRERPFFTDGLSLAMELLRRWPDERQWFQERIVRLEQLADLWATADPDSINLSTVITNDH